MVKRKKNKTHHSGLSQAEFLDWRSPRRGTTNPTRQNNAVWRWLFISKLNAYQSNQQFKGPDPFVAGPGWSNDRFGQTTTYLPDGRTIYIAGEHEDSYDPDFYIYNDVIVQHPNGELDFYGYPTDVFPPTDFHTATLVGNYIWIIGNLGYFDERKTKNTIPIHTLNASTLVMESISATGESPPSICHHSAAYLPENNNIQIMSGEIWQDKESEKNNTVWHFDLNTLSWAKKHEQQHINFQCRCEDNGYMQLDMFRELKKSIALNNKIEIERNSSYLREELGHDFNNNVLDDLYDFPFTDEPLQHYEFGSTYYYWTIVDGVKVTFEEDIFSLLVHIEDRITDKHLSALKKHLVRVLTKLHGKPFVIDTV